MKFNNTYIISWAICTGILIIKILILCFITETSIFFSNINIKIINIYINSAINTQSVYII